MKKAVAIVLFLALVTCAFLGCVEGGVYIDSYTYSDTNINSYTPTKSHDVQL